MKETKKAAPPGTAQSDAYGYKVKKFFLSIDPDTGEIDILPVSTPAEKVNFGSYIPRHIGTRTQMEALREEIIMNRVRKLKRKKIKI